MKQIAASLREFITQLNMRSLALIAVPLTLLTVVNYNVGLEAAMLKIPDLSIRFLACYSLYAAVFCGSMLAAMPWLHRNQLLRNRFFLILLLIAPAIFAWKWASGNLLSHNGTVAGRYLTIVLNPPLKCAVLFCCLYIIRKTGRYEHPLTGLKFRGVNYRPFLLLLLLSAPVIFFFGSTPAFLELYPRLQRVNFALNGSSLSWVTALIFELSYAFDFLFVEVYFRGFLVLAFLRYCGNAAILPMAALYCTIHFGKPAVECISSFFGGIMLGVIAYNSKSVIAGLILHLGIGWLMELAGWLWTK
jgi:hypothetical protein